MNIVSYTFTGDLYAICYESERGIKGCDLVAWRAPEGYLVYRLMYPRQPLVYAEDLPSKVYIDAAHAFEKFLVTEALG